MAEWTFLTNHGHVFVCLSRDPDIRVRDLAAQVGVTERAAQRIVSDLVEDGYVTRHRDGRRNRYTIRAQMPMRHPVEEDHLIGEVVDVLVRDRPAQRQSPRPSAIRPA